MRRSLEILVYFLWGVLLLVCAVSDYRKGDYGWMVANLAYFALAIKWGCEATEP